MNPKGPISIHSPQPYYDPTQDVKNVKINPYSSNSHLPNKILQSGISATNSNKKIEKSVSKATYVQEKPTDSLNQDTIPLSFSSILTKKQAEEVKSSLTNTVLLIRQSLDNVSFRVQFVEEALRVAHAFKLDNDLVKEEQYFHKANEQAQEAKKINCFHDLTHYASYLIKAYKGIDSMNMYSVREGILTLRRAVELNPNNEKVKIELERVIGFLKVKWKEMAAQEQIDANTHVALLDQLNHILVEDPFKGEFKSNPILFKLIRQAPQGFLKSYPHLASQEAFLKKYPDAGMVELLDGIYNMENLKKALTEAKTNSLVTGVPLLIKEPILTPMAAKLIKEAMIAHPKIHVYLGNQEDGNTLLAAFQSDDNWMKNAGKITRATCKMDNYDQAVYEYFL